MLITIKITSVVKCSGQMRQSIISCKLKTFAKWTDSFVGKANTELITQ